MLDRTTRVLIHLADLILAVIRLSLEEADWLARQLRAWVMAKRFL